MAIGAAAGVAIGGIAASAGATAATVAAVTAVSVAAVNGLIIGAVVGAATSAITGGDILKGALIGGGIGAVTGGFGEWLSPAAAATEGAVSGGMTALEAELGITGGASGSLEASIAAGVDATTAGLDTAAANSALAGPVLYDQNYVPGLVEGEAGYKPPVVTGGSAAAPPTGVKPPTPAGGAGGAKGGLISSITGADSFTKAMLISGGMQALGSGITAATQPDQEALLEKNAALAEQGRIAAMSQPGSVLNRWKQILDRSTISDAYSRYKINTGATTVSKPLATKTGLLAEGGAA